jgi:hypothetical protein
VGKRHRRIRARSAPGQVAGAANEKPGLEAHRAITACPTCVLPKAPVPVAGPYAARPSNSGLRNHFHATKSSRGPSCALAAGPDFAGVARRRCWPAQLDGKHLGWGLARALDRLGRERDRLGAAGLPQGLFPSNTHGRGNKRSRRWTSRDTPESSGSRSTSNEVRGVEREHVREARESRALCDRPRGGPESQPARGVRARASSREDRGSRCRTRRPFRSARLA